MRSKKYFKIILRQTIVWTITYSLLRFIRKYGEKLDDGVSVYGFTDLGQDIIVAPLIGFISALFFGTYEYVFRSYYKGRISFGLTVLFGTFGYLLTIIIFLISTFLVIGLIYNEHYTIDQFKQYLLTSGGLVTIVCYLIVGFIMEFVTQVDKKFGPGILRKMIFGKFHQPKEEKRIFMFIDMRSSTAIAEKLGHRKYCRLIQDCFKEIDVILPFGGEIYQYVGDEVVVTWELNEGIKDNNCILAFYSFTDRLKEKQKYYEKTYGLLPEFKAGANLGKVMVAEVGEIKREICYYGDTLNTAARIQSKCNDYGRDFLLSGKVVERLNESEGWTFKQMGVLKLKGKNQNTSIYSIERV